MIAFVVCTICFLIIGNILTSCFYRIPRGIPLSGKELKPCCSICMKRIEFPYYFPLIHLLIYGNRARCCGAIIPMIYSVIEIFTTGILIFLYFAVPIESVYFIPCTATVSLLILSVFFAIYDVAENFIIQSIFIGAILCLLFALRPGFDHYWSLIVRFMVFLILLLGRKKVDPIYSVVICSFSFLPYLGLFIFSFALGFLSLISKRMLFILERKNIAISKYINTFFRSVGLLTFLLSILVFCKYESLL